MNSSNKHTLKTRDEKIICGGGVGGWMIGDGRLRTGSGGSVIDNSERWI